MQYFPQLSSGAVVQYPFRKRRISRAVVNAMYDGSNRKLLDSMAAEVSWRLVYFGLSSAERAKLEQFFEAVEGRLGTFTFLDPTENLLVWSEQLMNPAWVKGAGLSLSEGIADPTGGNRATRISNGGGTVQSVEQRIDGPGWYRYCFSVWVRGALPGNVTLFRRTASATDSSSYPIGPVWRRLVLSGSFETADEGVRFGLEIEAGASVEAFGMQAECQPSPSEYRATTSRGGVYKTARLEEDSLAFVTDDLEAHSCQLGITAMTAG